MSVQHKTDSFRHGTWKHVAIIAAGWSVAAASLLIIAFGTWLLYNLALWLCVFGVIGWGTTFFVLWNGRIVTVTWKQAAGIITLWSLTGLILYGSWLDSYSGRDYVLRLDNLFAVVGTVGGLALGLMLKQSLPTLRWSQVPVIGLVWGVAMRLFPAIFLSLPGLELFLLPVAGFICGGIGSGITIWQINRAQPLIVPPTINEAPKLSEDGEFVSDWADGLAKPKRKPKVGAPPLTLYLRMGALAAAIAVIVAGTFVIIAPPRQVRVPVYVTGLPAPAIWDMNRPTPTARYSGYFRDRNYTVMLVNDISVHICENVRYDKVQKLDAGTPVIVQNASFSLTNSQYTYYVTSLDRTLCGEALTGQLVEVPQPTQTP